MRRDIEGLEIKIKEGRDISIDVVPEDKLSIQTNEGRMGCYEDVYTDYILIKDLYTFLNNRDDLFLKEANKICNEKKLNIDSLKKKYSELVKQNKILQNEIEILKESIIILK